MWEFLLGHAIGEDAARARHRRECCCHHEAPPARSGPSLWESAFRGTYRQWPFAVAGVLFMAVVVLGWFVPLDVHAGPFAGLVLYAMAAVVAEIPPRSSDRT